jgi:hypothetical protein
MHRPTWLTAFRRLGKTADPLFERGYLDAVRGLPCESTRREYMLGWVEGVEALRESRPSASVPALRIDEAARGAAGGTRALRAGGER